MLTTQPSCLVDELYVYVSVVKGCIVQLRYILSLNQWQYTVNSEIS